MIRWFPTYRLCLESNVTMPKTAFRVLLLHCFIVIFGMVTGTVGAQDRTRSDSAYSGRADSLPPVWLPEFRTGEISGDGQGRVFATDTMVKSPWGAVARSLVIPGWGQWYNDKKWKAPLYLVSDGIMIGIYMQRNKRVDELEKQRAMIDRQIRKDPFLSEERRRILKARFGDLTNDLDGALNRRNLFGWLFAISHLLGMIDAYTDAHLYQFDEKINMTVVPADNGFRLSVAWSIP